MRTSPRSFSTNLRHGTGSARLLRVVNSYVSSLSWGFRSKEQKRKSKRNLQHAIRLSDHPREGVLLARRLVRRAPREYPVPLRRSRVKLRIQHHQNWVGPPRLLQRSRVELPAPPRQNRVDLPVLLCRFRLGAALLRPTALTTGSVVALDSVPLLRSSTHVHLLL